MFPVDLPAVSGTDLRSASELYLSSLESRPHNDEWFQLSHTSKVAITANNVRWMQLFEGDQPACLLLALHPPDDPTRVVALYLHEKWWSVDNILRTSSKSRSGLISVQSIIERVIVFLLSQVVERSSQEEVLFSLHPRTESCKLLWRDSQAVGFYTVKHKGSLCDSWSSSCYLLPVLDTVLVRRSWRRKGFGLQMLQDFCSSFYTEKFLGVSSPLSPCMAAVCRSFLQQHKEHLEHLYEVEAPGGWAQRRNIWLNIQLGRYSLGIKEERRSTSEETQMNEDDSSQKIYNCRPDLTPLSSCNVNSPLVIGFSVQQVKPCDHSQGGCSPSSKISGTGCIPAAHINYLDCEPPTRLAQSLNTKQAIKVKPESEETQTSAKRVRKT
ncbi:protein FAM169B [Epinephelus fuscoguttatus]|uniref:protein FAM169B n=1 Tax=Epinephelus fuscoguttatus TaxID=293821 RepID=UPI0020CFFB93|nr:protein FAM169B [Epinephelus fuscoguttatus]